MLFQGASSWSSHMVCDDAHSMEAPLPQYEPLETEVDWSFLKQVSRDDNISIHPSLANLHDRWLGNIGQTLCLLKYSAFSPQHPKTMITSR
jgi:hypothetical protein